MNFLTGREENLFVCLTVGGKGCMAATAGILPEIMVGIYNASNEFNNYSQWECCDEETL
jgi:dihydrodipicolinate synthase/N-acetylneuraminate lyase